MSYDLWSRLRYVLSPQFDIYEQVANAVDGKVADIGSGTGFGTHLLTRNAIHVDGYEVDEAAYNFAKRSFSNGHIEFFNESITGTIAGNFEGGYNFITMIDVIEHIQEDKLAIQNVKRLLTEGGTFICSTPNRLSRYRKSDYHVREYSPRNLKGLLSSMFREVTLVDYRMQPLESEYENPIMGVCK
jgi:2-polyprenyl-3-methyl-5-hydroxy-6-metoxy-1,4-benzoquinol methylase